MNITIHVRPEGFFLSVDGVERTLIETDPRTPMTSRDWQMQLGTVFGVVSALLPPGTPVQVELVSLILAVGADGRAAILPLAGAPGS